MSGTAPTVVAGVLLAAGSSRRMGRDKLYLPIDGETLLARAARRTLEAGLDPVLVVTGPDAERARRELADLPVQLVPNPDHLSGQHTSLHAGLAQVPAAAAAALVVLADMPFVTPEMMREVVRRYREVRARIVVSRYGTVMAPPTLYDRSLFGEFTGDRSGKDMVRRHEGEAAIVDWPEERVSDLDVEDDYRAAVSRLAADASDRAG